MKIITFSKRKLSKIPQRHNFSCDNYIFPETRANKYKQWAYYSDLKIAEESVTDISEIL